MTMDMDHRKVAALKEEFGENATATVLRTVELFVDILGVDRSLSASLEAGCQRMAELVNDMLPSLEGQERRTRVYDYRDLNGCMDDLPTPVQNTFVQLVGTLMLNAKDGPWHAATVLNDSISAIAGTWGEEAA